MTSIADTSVLYAAFDRADARHDAMATRHSGLSCGLTDASVMVLVHDYGARDILTTDQRHFRALRPILGGTAASYRLLPFDL